MRRFFISTAVLIVLFRDEQPVGLQTHYVYSTRSFQHYKWHKKRFPSSRLIENYPSSTKYALHPDKLEIFIRDPQYDNGIHTPHALM